MMRVPIERCFRPVRRIAIDEMQPKGCATVELDVWICATRRLRMNDHIEKTIDLKAPVSRVWKALTDYREFGAWFRVKLEGPFVPGKASGGQITYPGYEHVRMQVIVQKIEPERLFSFTWHPYAVEPGIDYSKETPTLVEFTL